MNWAKKATVPPGIGFTRCLKWAKKDTVPPGVGFTRCHKWANKDTVPPGIGFTRCYSRHYAATSAHQDHGDRIILVADGIP